MPPAQPASLMLRGRKRRGWVPPDSALVAAARSFDAKWRTLHIVAPGAAHRGIVNLIRTTASRKEPDQPYCLIAVSIAGNDDRQDHLHVVTTSRAGEQAVRRQFAGIDRAVTGKRVYDIGGVIGYWSRNLCDDRGKEFVSDAVRAARRDYLAGRELPDPELDRLFEEFAAVEARRKPVDAPKAFKAPN